MSNYCDHCELAQEGDHCEYCGADLRAPEREPLDWKWKLFIVATIIYVIWRIYQLVSWLSH
jgi:uncharacterized paraquat-inducible protein A